MWSAGCRPTRNCIRLQTVQCKVQHPTGACINSHSPHNLKTYINLKFNPYINTHTHTHNNNYKWHMSVITITYLWTVAVKQLPSTFLQQSNNSHHLQTNLDYPLWQHCVSSYNLRYSYLEWARDLTVQSDITCYKSKIKTHYFPTYLCHIIVHFLSVALSLLAWTSELFFACTTKKCIFL